MLCCRMCRRDACFDTEAIIRINNMQEYSMGPVAEAEFIGSVKAPEDPRLQMLKI